MNALLTILYLLFCALIIIFVPPMVAGYTVDYGTVTAADTTKAILLCTVLASIGGCYAYKQTTDGVFLLRLFVAALLIRMLLGTALVVVRGQDCFGGDAMTYDYNGNAQLLAWYGDQYFQSIADHFVRSGEGAGWGMVYMVAAIYAVIGRNLLAVQLVNLLQLIQAISIGLKKDRRCTLF